MSKFNPVITTCPVCNKNLHITHLACAHCDTEIKGSFSFSKFNYLDKETLYFIEVFVKNRGNIKQIEKEMNISYPTVKKYLDEAIVALGYKVVEEETTTFEETTTTIDDADIKSNIRQAKLDVLDQIKAGKLKVEEALEKIRKLKVNKDE